MDNGILFCFVDDNWLGCWARATTHGNNPIPDVANGQQITA
jgi:hypothetical protein